LNDIDTFLAETDLYFT